MENIYEMRSNQFYKNCYLFLALIFICGCEKTDSVADFDLGTTKIDFVAGDDVESKAVGGSDINDFFVFGCYTGKETFQDFVASGKMIKADWMYNQKVLRNADNQFTYSPVRYWPLDAEAKITFYSYSALDYKDITIISPDAATTEGIPVFGYATNKENPTNDFLISRPAPDMTRVSGGVKFFMQHVLSRIQFNIRTTSSSQVTINSIGLKNVYTRAEFSAHGQLWQNLSDKTQLKSYTIPDADKMLSSKFKLLSQNYIVIPQAMEEINKPTFTLEFSVVSTDGSVNNVIKEFTPSNNWQQYNSYTYNITYEEGEVALDVATTVEPWVEKLVNEDIGGNQYLNVSTRTLDLAESEHIYYSSSFPITSVSPLANHKNADDTLGAEFTLSTFFDVLDVENKIKLTAKDLTAFKSDKFVIYIESKNLHDEVLVRLPITVIKEKNIDIEIDGTFWATGNIIVRDGHLDIANSANHSGLYFRWGSLVGVTGNNSASFTFDVTKNVGFIPREFTGTINSWGTVPHDQLAVTEEVSDAFEAMYGGVGYDAATGKGDPCRYMSSQKTWTKGKWRMPTRAEYNTIVTLRKIRKINGVWGISDESHMHEGATTGMLPMEAGWFVKASEGVDYPSDLNFIASSPPVGWIFIPAAGQRNGYAGSFSEFSVMGYYWTSTLASWGASYRFQFNGDASLDNLGRFDAIAGELLPALSVRCVRDVKTL